MSRTAYRSARNALRFSLPTEVSGICSRMWISRGRLVGARCSRAYASSSSPVTCSSPVSDTNAITSSPSGRRAGRPRGHRDRGVPGEHVLDVARVDVEPAADDEVLLAVDDAEVPVAVDRADVAGGEPPVVDVRCRRPLRWRPSPVAAHDVRAADEDLAVVGEADLDAREGLADRAAAGRVQGAAADDPAGLRAAVPFEDPRGRHQRSNASAAAGGSGAAPEKTNRRALRSAAARGWPSSMTIIDGTTAAVCARCSAASFSQPAGSNQRCSTATGGSAACIAPTVTIRP